MKIVQKSEKTNKIKKMFSIEEILVMVFGLLIRAMTSVHPHSGPVFSMVFAQNYLSQQTFVTICCHLASFWLCKLK